MGAGRTLAACALGALLLFALVASRVPQQGFVTVDLGALWLQVTGLASRGSAALPVGPLLAPVERQFWPWRYENTPPGPIADWAVLGGGWVAERGGRVLVIYPIGFAAPAATICRVIGPTGWLVLPVLAGAVACWATGRLGGRAGLARPVAAAWAATLASPVALYAVLGWGHAPAVAAAAVGWLLLAPGRGPAATAGAGFAFGLAGAFRNEGLALVALVAALLPVAGPAPRGRHLLAFVAGATLALAAPLAYNQRTFGALLDPTQASRTGELAHGGVPSAAAPGLAGRLANRAARAGRSGWESLVQSDRLTGTAGAVLGGAVILSLALLAAGRTRPGLWLATLVSALYAAFAWLVAPQQVPGLLLCAPALVPGLAALAAPRLWWDDLRLHGLACAAFLVVCALRGSPGWQWGGRYLLPAAPVLAVLAVRLCERAEAERGRGAATRVALATLLAAGSAMTVVGWRDLASEQRFREEEQRTVREAGATAVAFDHWWFSWNNAPLSADHELFFTHEPAELAALCDHLAARGAGQVTLITRAPSKDLETWTRAAAARGWRCTATWSGRLPWDHPWHALAFAR